jgi:UDP-glucuronate 4-epimerase
VAKPDIIVHLAAQAGVRYSLENPKAYVDSNLIGSWNVLELAKKVKPNHLLLASTSSIYGANPKIPFEETDKADEPLSLYAATKKGMEAMAHAYAHLYQLPTTAFRFFTVYGPWGRPDMALFKFTDAILGGRPIDVYGEGKMERDFTYVSDLIEAIARLMPLAPESTPVPFRIVNIGGGQPVGLMAFIETLERVLGKQSIRNMLPMQQGDVPRTFASPEFLKQLTGYSPQTGLAQGMSAFTSWYRDYYGK